jgi:hypothetical protein
MRELGGNDPRVKAAARQLEITVILRAWEEDGTMFIQDPWDTYEIPASTSPLRSGGDKRGGLDNTLPKSGGLSSDVRADDFTAISGVGSVTAQKLHDLGLFTYGDLRAWVDIVEEVEGISQRTIAQIGDWLAQRLV